MPRVFLWHNNQPLCACCTLGGLHLEGLQGCMEVLWVVAMCEFLFWTHGSALLKKENNTTDNFCRTFGNNDGDTKDQYKWVDGPQ